MHILKRKKQKVLHQDSFKMATWQPTFAAGSQTDPGHTDAVDCTAQYLEGLAKISPCNWFAERQNRSYPLPCGWHKDPTRILGSFLLYRTYSNPCQRARI